MPLLQPQGCHVTINASSCPQGPNASRPGTVDEGGRQSKLPAPSWALGDTGSESRSAEASLTGLGSGLAPHLPALGLPNLSSLSFHIWKVNGAGRSSSGGAVGGKAHRPLLGTGGFNLVMILVAEEWCSLGMGPPHGLPSVLEEPFPVS